MSAFTKDDLKRFQAESLHQKFQRSFAKVAEWFARWNNEVYVSFSGGKDSTVLADICAKWCKVIGKPLYLVFVNTGLEYPEIQRFVKEYAEYLRNKYGIEVVLEILRPKMRFDEVIKKYGYPLISKEISQDIVTARNTGAGRTYDKFEAGSNMAERHGGRYSLARWKPLRDSDIPISHMCCNVMKKKPAKDYERKTGRKPIIATMTEESRLREQSWLQYGCNAFEGTRAKSAPMSFWKEQDVLEYIKKEQLPIASVYGDIVYAEDPEQMRLEDYGIDCGGKEKLQTTGCDRTGCIFCAFGCHLEKEPSRFQRLKETHPRQYEYCIGGGEYVYKPFKRDENGEWQETDFAWEYDDGTPMTKQEIERFVQVHSVGFAGQKEEDLWIKFEKRWQPNKQGLGMGHVFDELNKIYGEDFIKYT